MNREIKETYRVGVVTLSDKGARGERQDESGPEICRMLMEEGQGRYEVTHSLLLPDDQEAIEGTLIQLCDKEGLDLILTTGGTGFSLRDVTPEATMAVATRNAPGIAEYMRAKSFAITPKAMVSRGVSVIRGRTLIINLPGSPKAVRENLGFILPALPHGLDILLGRDGECGVR
ncbi:MAG: molybdopterin adenylyltransferase [Firmicutes bacterium]|nr:molybdopterin adenylyltransferase [Bacillota bacterium]